MPPANGTPSWAGSNIACLCRSLRSSIATAGSIGGGGRTAILSHPPTLGGFSSDESTREESLGEPSRLRGPSSSTIFRPALGTDPVPPQHPLKRSCGAWPQCALFSNGEKTPRIADCDALERILLFLRQGSQVAREISTATNLRPSDQQRVFAHLRKLPEASSSHPGQEAQPPPPREQARRR